MNQCLTFNVYEDIMYPCVRADFLISDSIDLVASFPIIGEELIKVEFGQEGFDFTTSYTFHVKSLENQKNTPQSKGKTYTLHCASEEFITNSNQFITDKMQGNSEDVVRALFKNYMKSTKNVNLGDPTKGVQKLLFSRIRPLQAIDMVRKRSVSAKYISSSYVFFENKRGFNFCTIEYLINQLQDNVNDKQFFVDTGQNTDGRNMNTRSIIDFRNVSQVNNTQKISQGGLNNIVKRFDLLTGKVTSTQYINIEKQNQFQLADKPLPLNTTQFEQQHNQQPATSFLMPHSSDNPENFMDTILGSRHAFVTKMAQNIFQVFVYGDIALTAGDVITINVNTPQGSTGPSGDNRLLAGKYLISRLRHIVINGGPNPKSYMVSMELIKGFYEDYS